MRATHLLLKGHIERDTGEKCCICGCGTSDALKGKDFFGDTFRDYREMQARLSPYICSMCALSLKDVPSGVVTYLDGTKKTPRSALRGLGWRFFSWYLEEHGLPVHPVYAMTGGGRWDKYRLRVSAIGNPEGRGVGRLVWEREYYGDVLNRMGKTLWLREYDV